MEKHYDIIIIGGGPGGLTAALYSARAGRKTLVLERLMCGGQINVIKDIQNYPGAANIDGYVLGDIMRKQAESFGAEIIYEAAIKIDGGKVITANGKYFAPRIAIATGARAKKLGLPNEDELIGAGVSYCATCDGAFFKDKPVVVAGGGKKALEEALYLSAICRKVYLIAKATVNSGEEIEKLMNTRNIEIITPATIVSLEGTPLNSVVLDTGKRLSISGLFVAVGTQSETALLHDSGIKVDAKGFVITDENLMTNLNGIYAIGDVRSNSSRQIITACAEGAMVAMLK